QVLPAGAAAGQRGDYRSAPGGREVVAGGHRRIAQVRRVSPGEAPVRQGWAERNWPEEERRPMKRSAYYQEMKALARQVRADHGLTTPRVLRSDLRRIYKHHGIRIDLWPHRFKRLRGAYFFDDLGATVMLARGLPADPMVFTMGHELKHHLADRESGL